MAISFFPSKIDECLVLCLSTDTKPASPTNNWMLIEIDSGKVFRGENGAWVEKINNSYQPSGSSASWGGVSGTLSAQTDLQAALDAKGTSNFNGVYSSLSGIPATFAPVIGAGATQACAGNDTRLSDARTPLAHNHDASYEAAGAVAAHAAAADPHAGYQKESEKAAVNGYASLGADGKVPAAQLPAAGSDPWTYLRLASDFPTSSATAVDITGLGFAPAANQRYEFEAQLMLRTATATVNPRTGLAWPTGMVDGVASIDQSQTATTQLMARGSIAAALLIAVGGLTNTTASWPCTVLGVAVAGATPSGNIRLQMASETAGTTVTMRAGSFLKYRTIP